MADRGYKPALRFGALTGLFDPVAALTTRESTFKARVVQRAALRPGEDVLDLGCGTGTLALAALAEEPAARLTGLDADPEVLARARRKAEIAGAEIAFDEGFSTELPYADGRFDALLSTLFFHHLEDGDKRRTAAEALRVLRPGGRLAVADLGRPQDPLMRTAALFTVQLLDGFATTSASVGGKLPGMLADAGFAEVRITDRLRTPIGTLEVLTGRRP